MSPVSRSDQVDVNAPSSTSANSAVVVRHGTLVTIATYNEIENLPRLVDEIFSYVPDVDVLVIDDNSPDGTGHWCDERSQTDSRLRCLHRSGKLGLGSAMIAGQKFAIEKDYEFVLNMDADFSHHPRYINNLLSAMVVGGDQAPDVMIGSRYVPGGRVEGWSFKRHFMSRTVNFFARRLLGLRTRDCSGAFRCYRIALLKQLDYGQIKSHGYAFQEEILWHLKRLGARMGESPIVFVDRQHGKSKIGGEAFAAAYILFRLGLRNWLRI